MNHDHIACNKAGRIGATPGISLAIEDYRTVAVGWITKNLMEKHGEAVEVTNVEWAEISVEGIVKKSVINGEVHGRAALGVAGWARARLLGDFGASRWKGNGVLELGAES